MTAMSASGGKVAQSVEPVGYTKGPWVCSGEATRVRNSNGGDDILWCGGIEAARKCGGKYRGEIAHVQSADHIDGITREEAAANARLIGALPELVDALQEAREFIDGQVDVVDGSYGEPSPNRAMSLARLIDEVLGKAGVR